METIVQQLLTWQFKAALIALLTLLVLSSLTFYSAKNRVLVIRIGILSILLMSMAELFFQKTQIAIPIVISIEQGSGAAYLMSQSYGLLQLLAIIILCCCVISLARLVTQHLRIKSALAEALPLQNSAACRIAKEFHDHQQRNTKRLPQIYLSNLVDSACTYGFLNPRILINPNLLRDNCALEMALVHELNHISNRDWFWQQICSVIQTLFPLDLSIRKLSNQHSLRIEEVCDSQCLDSGIDHLSYAHFLHGLKKQGGINKLQAAVPAAELSTLGERIELLINQNSPKQTLTSWQSFTLIGFMVLSATAIGVLDLKTRISQPLHPLSTSLIEYQGYEDLEPALIRPNNPDISPPLNRVQIPLPHLSDAELAPSEYEQFESSYEIALPENLAPP